MPHLTFEVDHAGRMVIDLFITKGAPEFEALVGLGFDGVQPQPDRALVDTGASITLIERSLVEILSLGPVGDVEVHTAFTGRRPIKSLMYGAQLFFPGMANGVLAADLAVVSTEDLGGLEVQMLLGRNVLEGCLLFCNGPEQQFTLAF